MGWIRRRRERRAARLGWKPDERDRRDKDFADLDFPMGTSLTGTVRDESSMRAHCPDVYSQSSTNSCVAQGVAGAIQTAEIYRNIPSEIPSRLFMYANARLLHGAIRRDSGTHIRLCMKMLNRLGVPDEKYWPWSTKSRTVNRRPSWAASMRAHPRMGGKYNRIFDLGENRSTAIKIAIDAALPVVFGTQVHQSFLSRKGPVVIENRFDSDDDIVGGHAMVIIGYKNSRANGLLFEVRNSWGPGWRDRGYCWMTEDFIRSNARDLWVVHGWHNWIDAAF